jgi:hypothetical protein
VSERKLLQREGKFQFWQKKKVSSKIITGMRFEKKEIVEILSSISTIAK